MICADCDRVIVGPAVRLVLGDSMSGARPDTVVHPAGSPDCRPRGHAKLALHRELAKAAEQRTPTRRPRARR
ncbi:hypothetical protein [Streptomyces californicus]|uniref:hypothetical protein n=1 Tax=Streptomyces californicus TaxID=67351 RepID=UPI0038116D6D